MLAVAALTVAWLAIASHAPGWLIGTPEYHWPVLRHGEWARLPGAAFAVALCCAAGVMLASGVEHVLWHKFGRARIYLALFLLGLSFQLGTASVHRMGLLELPLRVYLPDHTSYFTDAKKIEDLDLWLRTFPANIKRMETHTRTHPPGAVLLFYGAIQAAERCPSFSRWYQRNVPRSDEAMQRFELSAAEAAAGGLCALVLLLAASAAAPLGFAIGRVITDDRKAVLGAVLFAAMPSFTHKTPSLDHLLAGLILFSVWLCISAIRNKQVWRVALAGAVIGAGLWLGTALLAAVPLCLFYMGAGAREFSREKAQAKNLVILAASLGVIICACTAAVTLMGGAVFGVSWLEVYTAITDVGWRLNNELSGRESVWMWVAFGPYELLAWAGAPATAYFLLGVGRNVKLAARRKFSEVDPWVAALVLILAALFLSGRVVYEAPRLTWFCYPLIGLSASKGLSSSLEGKAIAGPAIIVGLTAASALVFRMVY